MSPCYGLGFCIHRPEAAAKNNCEAENSPFAIIVAGRTTNERPIEFAQAISLQQLGQSSDISIVSSFVSASSKAIRKLRYFYIVF